MTRSKTRDEWPSARRVYLNPGGIEIKTREILLSPYRDPTLVPWMSSLRSVGYTVWRGNSAK